jgi:CDP-glucose 4,6-dehydratase
VNYFVNHYKGKKVLVTGHTGFKGSWLSAWLHHLGAEVIGFSIDLPSNPNNFEISRLINIVEDYRIDVCDAFAVRKVINDTQPDFVFHLAAQALVRSSYENPLTTLATNAIGTANVMDALRVLDKPVVAVMITSDKVYDNAEWVWGYRETDSLGGKDPYSASKGMAELAIRTYIESCFNSNDNNVRIGITRAGNVIGGGDWARDRIVPDCMKSCSKDKMVDIRSPWATRPWQLVLEPLSGYLTLGAALSDNSFLHGESYNFGPPAHQNHSVADLINEMSKYWDSVRWNDISKTEQHMHEAGLLKLNCDKALFDLKWHSTLKFEETVQMTVEWYKTFYQNPNISMYDFTIKQIEEYTRLALQREMKWAIK